MAIDDDGHTALHWRARMGRIRIVKISALAGGGHLQVNRAGQTALMRSVMFATLRVRESPGAVTSCCTGPTLNIDN